MKEEKQQGSVNDHLANERVSFKSWLDKCI